MALSIFLRLVFVASVVTVSALKDKAQGEEHGEQYPSLSHMMRTESFSRVTAAGAVDEAGWVSHDGSQMPASSSTESGAMLVAKPGDSVDPASKPTHSDWLHNAKEKNPLPPWAQILIGSLTTLVILGCYTCVKVRVSSPVPRGANSDRLQVVLEEALEKVEVLKAELGERHQDLAPLDDGADPELAAERARARDYQEKADARSKEIHEAAAKVAEQKESLISGSIAAQVAFSGAIETGRERLEDFSKLETTDLYAKVQHAVSEPQGAIPAWDVPDFGAEDEDFFTLPSPLYLLQGAFAPSLIHRVRESGNWIWFVDLALITASVVTIVIDHKKRCQDNLVVIWHIGFLIATTLDFLARTVITRWCDTALSSLKESREEMERSSANRTGNSMVDSISNLRQGCQSFFVAHFKHKGIVDSWLYALVGFILLFDLGWGGFGLWISIHDIVVDTFGCQARTSLRYLHTYSFFYVLLLTWKLANLSLWIVSHISSSNAVSSPIIKAARQFDDDTMKGMPVALTLMESFVLKNSSSAIGMTKRQVIEDVSSLTLRMEELEEKLKESKRAKERLEELKAGSRTQEEFMERCQQKLENGLEQAKPLVGLIAANVRTSDLGGIDPTAGSTAKKTMRSKGGGSSAQKVVEDYGSEPEDAEEANASDVEGF